MANDTLQFVDSVSASATLRLDINDGTLWEAEYDGFDFSPPSLRRAINGTLLTDGSVVSASSYDNRVLKMSLSLIAGTVDLVNTQLQLLSRELDRDGNYLKWQPNTATSPVFFRTLRSAYTRITEIPGNGTFKTFDIEVLAEPFALGLREDVAIGTVNNDPAAGSNGMFFDVTGVKGDVAAPMIIESNGVAGSGMYLAMIAVRQHGTPSDLIHFFQCEAMTLGTDTTNPGGGPDALMSGATLNNFVRTSFATTTTMIKRLSISFAAMTAAQRQAIRGTYRVLAFVRQSASTSVITARVATQVNAFSTPAANTAVTVQNGGGRSFADLGLISLNQDVPAAVGYGVAAQAPSAYGFELDAARVGGTDTLDWDHVLLLPADESLLLFQAAGSSLSPWIVDSVNEAVYSPESTTSPFAGTVGLSGAFAIGNVAPFAISGGFPMVKPNQTNRIFLFTTAGAPVAAATNSITVSYWPRYLYDRPAAT